MLLFMGSQRIRHNLATEQQANQDKAVIIDLGCTLLSPRELLKRRISGSTLRNADLIGLGCGLGIGTLSVHSELRATGIQ